MLSYVAKHSKQRKTTKPIKLQWLASIGFQNDQNKSKLHKWSKSNDLHRFDLKTINNVEFGPKTFKTTQNYKTDQITMNCIDWMSKLSKQSKTTKVINIQRLASIWRQNDQKCWVTSQNIQNNAKLQNRSNYNELHRLDVKTIKTSKTTKVINIQWLASISRQNDQKWWVTSQNIQNNAKLQNRSFYNDLHRLDFKMIKTNLNYKSDLNYKSHQNPMTCIDLTSKRSKMLSYVAKHSKQRKTIKPIKCNELHWFNVKTIKTKLNYKSDQNPMTCIDLTSKRSIMLSLVPKHSKQRKTTKPIKLQWIASIGCQNYQNKAKLQKWSISKDLHRFDVKTIKNVELRRKTFKTTQNYKTDQITMTCIDWISKWSKQI